MKAEPIPCYIANVNTGSTVSFSVEIPEQVSDSYSTNYSTQTTKGRSSPFKAYQSSGPRSVSFTVTMALDLRRDLKNTVEALRTMLKPVDAGYILAPRVHVRIGDILNIEAVPMSFDVTWREGYKDNVYRVCDCSFAFDEVEDHGTFAESLSSTYQVELTTPVLKKPVPEVDPATRDTFVAENSILGWINMQDAMDMSKYDRQEIPAGTYNISARYKNILLIYYNGTAYWIREESYG